MKTRLFSAIFVSGLFTAASTAAVTVFEDDFEGYVDDVGLAGVWTLGDGTLVGSGNPGNALSHPGTAASFSGANTNSVTFGPIVPGAGETLIFSVDIYDDGLSANERVTAGLRNSGSSNILELGMYNSPNHYAYRTVLFGGGDTNWLAFASLVDDVGGAITNEPVAGWHRYSAEITDSQITFSLDLNSDGNINATATHAITTSVTGFNTIRLGGPSDLSSPGGGAQFDNVSLVMIPEPSASLLLGVAALAMLRRRRCC